MGNITKIVLGSALIMLVIVYAVMGYSINKAMDEKIAKLEAMAESVTKKKEFMIEQSVSLASVKKNLETELALEVDKAVQKEIASQLMALNEEQRQKYLQQMDLLQQQQLELQRQQQLAAAKKTTTKSSSSGSTTTTSTPATTPAPTPPKVTSAS